MFFTTKPIRLCILIASDRMNIIKAIALYIDIQQHVYKWDG